MQYLGHMNQAWLFVSYAARLLTALNYHEIRSPVQDLDTNEEAYSCLHWCYYLDRTLSALLHRPVSLPSLQVSPTDLISVDATMCHLPLIRIIMNLAQVQGELLGCGKMTSTRQEALSYHTQLQDRMAVIRGSIDAVRAPQAERLRLILSSNIHHRRVHLLPRQPCHRIGLRRTFAIMQFSSIFSGHG